ncbi:DUF3427 domain-containing protein [Reichenbachiella sp.]|uniref:DUF3427 domain-containing protein n=1 Tax=Reichenbachiella sp. TaxID=2184521 RepID=UPI00329A5D4C
MFTIDAKYSKNDIYKILNVPKEKRKGAWDTGYREFEGDIYIFANIGIAGRTGHDYTNFWDGDLFYWQAKERSKVNQPLIQNILNPNREGVIHVFTRTENTEPFTYEGIGSVNRYKDTQPVRIVWKFTTLQYILHRNEKIPEELSPEVLVEGFGRSVVVNKYERNPLARRLCIDHHGAKCQVCKFDFEKVYGEIGKGFIHVHHIVPIAEITGEYNIDPVKDLVPVCPNCHAMIHRRNPIFSIKELNDIIKKRN